MKFYYCSYCGALGLPKQDMPPAGHVSRGDGTLTCPKAVDKGRIDDLFRQLYEVTA